MHLRNINIRSWRDYTLPDSKEMFRALIQQTAEYKHIPEIAVLKDFFICKILSKLSSSPYNEKIVFKGGTSLSKCYPGTIERFSEDIDLTYIPLEGESAKEIERYLKQVEKFLSENLNIEKVAAERSNCNKSAYIWEDELGKDCRVKLEIGSSVRPEPYSCFKIKAYLREYLQTVDKKIGDQYISQYDLNEFNVYVLNIERTFMDKVFAIKRHTLEGSISSKARHLYDVVQLWNSEYIKSLVLNKKELLDLIHLIKTTDAEYLSGKRKCKYYNPQEPFGYSRWKDSLAIAELKNSYEKLHLDLLYTDDVQKFSIALEVMEEIGLLFESINE